MRFLTAITLVFCVLLVNMQSVSAQTDGLAYTEDTVFTVTDAGVQVVTEAVMTNTTAERREGNTVFYSYFDDFLIVVPTEAEDLRVLSRGQQLRTEKRELDEDFEIRSAAIPSQLKSGETRTFTVSYTLPRGVIRDDGLFFSNPAFHAFPVWSFSDPGTGSLSLRFPVGSDLGDLGEALERTGVDGGFEEWVPRDFDVPEELFSFVTITRKEALEVDRFSVAGQDVELRVWPGDLEWAAFAKDTIADGLPKLEELIGLPVPDQETLEITESVTPYFFGYGGWYNPVDTSIEIGNELDQNVMVHELSHAWFNDSLFNERWVSEGLAEEFTWRVQEDLNWIQEELPARPDRNSPSAVPLVTWGRTNTSTRGEDAFREREEYGYNASWYVIREITDAVGLDGMQRLIADADANRPAYPGVDAQERTDRLDDWRRFLDLASATATVEQEARINQVFADFVIRESDLAELNARANVRVAFNELSRDPLNWRIPEDLRFAMETWDFDEAERILNQAREVQRRYGAVLSDAEATGLELSLAAKNEYESDDPDFGEALEVLDQQAALIPSVLAIRATASREFTTEERWGAGDVLLQPYVDRAEQGFAADDARAVENAQRSLELVRLQIAQAGANRIRWAKIGAGAFGATLLMAGWMAGRRREDVPQAPPTEIVAAA